MLLEDYLYPFAHIADLWYLVIFAAHDNIIYCKVTKVMTP